MRDLLRRLINFIREILGKDPIPEPEPEPAPAPTPAPTPDPLPDIAASFPGNWCFAVCEFEGHPFLSISNNGGTEQRPDCRVKVWADGWFDNLVMGIGTEDICKLILHPPSGRMYVIMETNDGIYFRGPDADPRGWRRSYKFAGKPSQYGSFDAVNLGDHLYVPVSGFDPGYPLDLLKLAVWGDPYDDQWHIFPLFYALSERVTGWAIGADREYLYLGIAGFARGTRAPTRYDGIWQVHPNTLFKKQESRALAQSFAGLSSGEMIAGCTGGDILARKGGVWPTIYRTGCRFVCSLAVIGDALWIGGDDPARLIVTRDCVKFETVREWPSGNCCVGAWRGKPVWSHWENGTVSVGMIR